MSEEQLEAEVSRVVKVVRDFLRKAINEAETLELTDLRIATWGVIAVALTTDADGNTQEAALAGWETSSRVTQCGVLHKLAFQSLTEGSDD